LNGVGKGVEDRFGDTLESRRVGVAQVVLDSCFEVFARLFGVLEGKEDGRCGIDSALVQVG